MRTGAILLILGCLIGYVAGYLRHRPANARESVEVIGEDGESAESSSRRLVESAVSDRWREERITELEARLRHYSREEAERQMEREAVIAESTESKIRAELIKIKSVVTLSPQQERDIEMLLEEYWAYRYTYREMSAEERKGLNGPEFEIEGAISAVLNEEQRPIYKEHLAHEARSDVEVIATMKLGEYPVTFSLSEEQKNLIYSNIYNAFDRRESKKEFASFAEEFNRVNQTAYHPNDLLLVWAARDQLTEAQLEHLLSSIAESK